MEITVAHDQVLLLKDQITENEAEKIAWKQKNDAFGTIQKVTSFLNRPSDEDFKLTYKEHRYIPFWHITGTAKYAYDRTTQYAWPIGGPEVTSITLEGHEYTVDNGDVSIPITKHCRQEESEEIFVDGLSGVRKTDLKDYLQYSVREMQKIDIEDLAKKNVVI